MDMEKDQLDFFILSPTTLFNSTMIHGALGGLSKWFWNPAFWLPVNFTWEDIKPREDFKYPDTNDILTYPLGVAIILLIIRYYVIYPYIFYPIANYYHLNTKKPQLPKENKELEQLYEKYNTNVPDKILDNLYAKRNIKTSEAKKWLRQRKAITKLTIGEKFADSGFMLINHLFFCFLGFYVLYDKIWVWNISHCWYKYPHHEVDPDIWFYYMFGLGSYLSFTLHQVSQPSRKDRLAIYMHHLFTISLMCFSWVMNFVRFGTLVLVVHQCVDWLLLSAKLLMYIGNEKLTNIVFALTVIVWVTSRLILFPYWILRSAIFEGPTYMFMPSAYLFYTLLFGLLLLNLMWLAMMIAAIVKKIRSGKLEDVRSDEEFSDQELEDKKDL